MVNRYSSELSGASSTATCVKTNLPRTTSNLLPKFHLPQWHELEGCQKLPLGPILDSRDPDGSLVHLHFNKLGEKCVKPTHDAEFDTKLLPKELLAYRPENDPYLKFYLQAPQIKDHLKKQGLISEEDDVPRCAKEYNAFRRYAEELQKRLTRKKADTLEQLLLTKTPKRKSLRDYDAEDYYRIEKIKELRSNLADEYALLKEAELDIVDAEDRMRRRMNQTHMPLTQQSEMNLNREIVKKKTVVQQRQKLLEEIESHIEMLLNKHAKELTIRREATHARFKKLQTDYEFRRRIQQAILDEKEQQNELHRLRREERLQRKMEIEQAALEEKEVKLKEEKEKRHQERMKEEEEFVQRMAKKLVVKRFSYDGSDFVKPNGTLQSWERLSDIGAASASTVKGWDTSKCVEHTFTLNWHPQKLMKDLQEQESAESVESSTSWRKSVPERSSESLMKTKKGKTRIPTRRILHELDHYVLTKSESSESTKSKKKGSA